MHHCELMKTMIPYSRYLVLVCFLCVYFIRIENCAIDKKDKMKKNPKI